MTKLDVTQLKVIKAREEVDRAISKMKDALATMEAIKIKLGQIALDILLTSQGK